MARKRSGFTFGAGLSDAPLPIKVRRTVEHFPSNGISVMPSPYKVSNSYNVNRQIPIAIEPMPERRFPVHLNDSLTITPINREKVVKPKMSAPMSIIPIRRNEPEIVTGMPIIVNTRSLQNDEFSPYISHVSTTKIMNLTNNGYIGSTVKHANVKQKDSPVQGSTVKKTNVKGMNSFCFSSVLKKTTIKGMDNPSLGSSFNKTNIRGVDLGSTVKKTHTKRVHPVSLGFTGAKPVVKENSSHTQYKLPGLPNVTISKKPKNNFKGQRSPFPASNPIAMIDLDDDDVIINEVAIEFERDSSTNPEVKPNEEVDGKKDDNHNPCGIEIIDSFSILNDSSEKENYVPFKVKNSETVVDFATSLNKSFDKNNENNSTKTSDAHISERTSKSYNSNKKTMIVDNISISETDSNMETLTDIDCNAKKLINPNNCTDNNVPVVKETSNRKTFPGEICECYRKFLDLCLELDDTDEMKVIVNKKLTNYYRSVDPAYTNSEAFRLFMEEKVIETLKTPNYLFIYIKDVVMELKSRRSEQNGSKQGISATETNENDRNENRLKKLERRMLKLHKNIKKLEEQEVDYDDDEDSAYILADREKALLMRTYEKICKIRGERGIGPTRKANKIFSRLQLGRIEIPNLMNAVKSMATSNPHWFPDFHDILKCVKHCASKANLKLSDFELQMEARDVFSEIGTILQKRRKEEEYQNLCVLLMGADGDPADSDPVLAAALDKNRKIYKEKENELINKFANKEVELKLISKEVNDEDIDKTDVSDDDSNDKEKNKHSIRKNIKLKEKPGSSKDTSDNVSQNKLCDKIDNECVNNVTSNATDDSDVELVNDKPCHDESESDVELVSSECESVHISNGNDSDLELITTEN